MESSSSSSSTTVAPLLDKYTNLHSQLGQVTKELQQIQAQEERCQQDIQILLQERQSMKDDMEASQNKIQDLARQMQETKDTLRELHPASKAQEQERKRAQTVASMMKRRSTEYRQDYEQSRRNFQKACYQAMNAQEEHDEDYDDDLEDHHGNIRGRHRKRNLFIREDASSSLESNLENVVTEDVTNLDELEEYDVLEEDHAHSNGGDSPPGRPHRNATRLDSANGNLSTTCNNPLEEIDILKVDWSLLLGKICLPSASPEPVDIPGDNEHEASSHVERQDTDQDGNHAESLKSLTEQTSIAEERQSSSDDHPSDGNGNGDEDEQAEVGSSTAEHKDLQAQAGEIDHDCSDLFKRYLRRVQKAKEHQENIVDQARQKASKAQSQYDLVLKARDEVRTVYEENSAKAQKQRMHKTNLSNQVERLSKDIQDLQDHLGHVQAQTRQLKEPSTASTRPSMDRSSVPKRQRMMPNESATTSASSRASNHAWTNRNTSNTAGPPALTRKRAPRNNPYAKQKSSNHATSIEQENINKLPRDEGHHPEEEMAQSTAGRAVVSPVGEHCGRMMIESSSVAATTLSVTHGKPRKKCVFQRVGRVRGAKGFGISSSLEQSARSLGVSSVAANLPISMGQIPSVSKAASRPRDCQHFDQEEIYQEEVGWQDDLLRAEEQDKATRTQTPSARRSAPVVSTTKKNTMKRNRSSALPKPDESSSEAGDSSSDDNDSAVLRFALRK